MLRTFGELSVEHLNRQANSYTDIYLVGILIFNKCDPNTFLTLWLS